MNPSKSLRGIGVDRDDFKILPEPTMKGLAEYMKGKDCRKVVLMVRYSQNEGGRVLTREIQLGAGQWSTRSRRPAD